MENRNTIITTIDSKYKVCTRYKGELCTNLVQESYYAKPYHRLKKTGQNSIKFQFGVPYNIKDETRIIPAKIS